MKIDTDRLRKALKRYDQLKAEEIERRYPTGRPGVDDKAALQEFDKLEARTSQMGTDITTIEVVADVLKVYMRKGKIG